ncbi:hypothetical protein HXA34_05930 [Salipaludibacillus agaradhaerens]|uniref:hypothetical protein n=1 Tax=Salipaludibacillus agaradhaerens TaxID=76935 RepID=UPI002151EA78|nr:hypothetical protein [Salipaludibacillus agaradhaerens]MCR6105829.1 hypothetical protein [Salipaludibacillus agaradhaerens]MCR6117864.1 hypothetical protein [Salipaludibacillus agaradhaerens]
MTKKISILIFIIAVVMISMISCRNMSSKPDRVHIEGIENFQPSRTHSEESYLLYYPADIRVSQNVTLVKEVNNKGETLVEYEITDEDFRRVVTHQKPNNLNELYLSFFGEATIDNYFFTYDIRNNHFKKIELDYFDVPVGVDHIKHFGEDVLLQNLVSHKTGDQNLDENGNFSVSMTNVTTEQSFETELGFVPRWAPILQFKKRIIFGTSGYYNEEDEYVAPNIGISSLEEGNIDYLTFNDTKEELFPVYANTDFAYIIGSSGQMYTLDEGFNIQTFKPFEELSFQDYYFYEESNAYLMLNEKKALYSVIGESGTIFGILTLNDHPEFTLLKDSFTEEGKTYNVLYQNSDEEELYIIELGDEMDNVIVLNSHDLTLKYKFPIEQGYLMDFVVKLKK